MPLNVQYKDNSNYAIAPDGQYLCKLISVKEVDGQAFGSNAKTRKILFIFEALEVVQEDGEPYRFFHRVNPIYGPDKAKLTQLLDKMIGRRLTKEEFAGLDLEKLVGRKYSVMVTSHVGGDGNTYNDVISVIPVAKPRPAENSTQTAPVARQQSAPALRPQPSHRPAPVPVAAVAEDSFDDDGYDDPFADS